jgi:hypothetical protein
MQTEDMIVLEQFCDSHHLEISFLRSLEEYGLVEITMVDQTQYVSNDELPKLEQMVRLHHELHINAEGIDAINNLLDRIENLQHQIVKLENRLNFYEEKDQ